VPVFNEEPMNLRRLVLAVRDVLEVCNVDHELVFINDGSSNTTNSILRQLTQEFANVGLVVLSRNFGEQAAISAGLIYATGDAVVNMDSDLQDPPEVIPQMIALWREGFDVVYTRQVARRESFLKVLPAQLFYRLLTFLSDIHITPDCGEFRLLSRRVVDTLNALPEKSRFLRGLVPWVGFKQKEIPFVRRAREVGTSAYSLRKLVDLAVQGLVSFSTMPLRLIGVLGATVMIVSAVLLFNALSHNLAITNEVVLEGCGLFAGLQLSMLGVISMYLIQLISESRGRPTFIVSEFVGAAQEKTVQSMKPLAVR
jgi:glycosyltransferase involved in cell wall biosynthesis